tara:strand:- start:279 stop:497 length:219 start_codon:yes stop_codon:yes gene_type:complete
MKSIEKFSELDMSEISLNTFSINTQELDSLNHIQILINLLGIYNFELNTDFIINHNSFFAVKNLFTKAFKSI